MLVFAATELNWFHWVMINLVSATFIMLGISAILIAWAIVKFELRIIFGKQEPRVKGADFTQTLKQHYTMSFNARRDHHGTMWESHYRVRVKNPGESGMMMAESGYADAKPVNAGIVDWPDMYEWCSFAAACRGDQAARAGYDFIYGEKGRSWAELKDLHDISIRQMLKEREWKDAEDLKLVLANKRPERRGKCYAASLETPGYVPQVIEKGDNVLALRLLRLLQWEPKPPAYLRTTLGISSREYFTKAYLRPLTEAGLIARSDPDHPNSPL